MKHTQSTLVVRSPHRPPLPPAVLLGVALIATLISGCGEAPPEPGKIATTQPALSVNTTLPHRENWPQTLIANGNIAPWQEAVIGPELSNYAITEVNANVGDRVKKGQVLARIASATVDSELAESRAVLAEAEATLQEAQANQERARQLRAQGFYSPQQGTQTDTAAATALARLNAARARLQSVALKQAKTTVGAPDDGIISARSATVGTLTQTGQELFRLIRQARLEWRAEVTADEISRLKPGQLAVLTSPSGTTLEGRIRVVAPTVDSQTRNALVYVDLPPEASQQLSAGMFARGEFRLGHSPALTLPQSAVLLRDGFAYVFRVDRDPAGAGAGAAATNEAVDKAVSARGKQESGQAGSPIISDKTAKEPRQETGKVRQIKVTTGRREGTRIEVIGLDALVSVVANGVGFLADGDTVAIVAATPAP